MIFLLLQNILFLLTILLILIGVEIRNIAMNIKIIIAVDAHIFIIIFYIKFLI